MALRAPTHFFEPEDYLSLELESLGCTLALAEVYAKVVLGGEKRSG